MKTLSLALNVLLILAFSIYACNRPSSPTPVINDPVDPVADCTQRNCKDYTGIPLEGLISGRVLQSMTNDYKNDPGKKYVSASLTSETRSSVEDARSIWFSLEKIKHYIWYIENQLCKSDCPDSSKLGIRFYYMKYPSNVGTPQADEDLRDVPAEYANLHSLAMVPGYIIDNKLVDFDPRYIGAGCNLRFLKRSKMEKQGGKMYTDTAKVAFILKSNASSDGQGNNHGGLEPPRGDGIFGN